MADFNSRYTGAEVEAAIAKSEKISEFVEVWSGTPTNTGIDLSSLPVNPATGDRTGLYYVSIGGSTNPLDKAGLSTLHITDENGELEGTLLGGATSSVLSLRKSKYNESGSRKIHAYYISHNWGGSDGTIEEIYIYNIHRLQKAS